jgi:hypothetical protein
MASFYKRINGNRKFKVQTEREQLGKLPFSASPSDVSGISWLPIEGG